MFFIFHYRRRAGSVLGAVFLESFYVVFDRRNQRIGFAESSCSLRLPGSALSVVAEPDFATGQYPESFSVFFSLSCSESCSESCSVSGVESLLCAVS